jgi:excisionase family DNA binding protein
LKAYECKFLQNCPDVLDVQGLAEILGIGKNKAYELLKRKSIKSLRIGKIYKIPKLYIAEFLQNYD